MSLLQNLRKLQSEFALIKEEQPSTKTEIGSALFKILPLAAKGKGSKDTKESINYGDRGDATGLLDNISKLMYGAYLSDTASKPSLYQSKFGLKCTELDIIKAAKVFKIPMDFEFTYKTKAVNFSELMALVFQRVQDFYATNMALALSDYTYLLSDLVHLDLEASPELEKQSDALLSLLFTNALKTTKSSKKPTVEECINLLWANAIHGLRGQTYKQYIAWDDVKSILEDIQNRCGNLDKKTAKMLFQVYAANYEHRDEFPKQLLSKMQGFITIFQVGTHGSSFETRIQKEFGYLYKKLNEEYPHIDWKERLNFSNPITSFGLETDILYDDPTTGHQVAIQVDGADYHTFPTAQKNSAKVSKKTRFRDFCFDNAGIAHFEISGEGNYSPKIESQLRHLIVFPNYLKMQKQRLDKLIKSKEAVETTLSELEEKIKQSLVTLATQKTQVTELEEKKKLLSQKLASFKDVVDTNTAPQERATGTQNISLLEKQLQETQSQLLKNKEILQKHLEEINTLKKSAKELDVFITEFKPFVEDLEPEVLRLEEELALLKQREQIYNIEKTQREKEYRAAAKSETTLEVDKSKYAARLKIVQRLLDWDKKDEKIAKEIVEVYGTQREKKKSGTIMLSNAEKWLTENQSSLEQEQATLSDELTKVKDKLAHITQLRILADDTSEMKKIRGERENSVQQLTIILAKAKSQMADHPGKNIVSKFYAKLGVIKKQIEKITAEHENILNQKDTFAPMNESLSLANADIEKADALIQAHLQQKRNTLLSEARLIEERAKELKFTSYSLYLLTADSFNTLLKAVKPEDFKAVELNITKVETQIKEEVKRREDEKRLEQAKRLEEARRLEQAKRLEEARRLEQVKATSVQQVDDYDSFTDANTPQQYYLPSYPVMTQPAFYNPNCHQQIWYQQQQHLQWQQMMYQQQQYQQYLQMQHEAHQQGQSGNYKPK